MSSSVPGQRWRTRRIWGATTSIVVMLMASLLAWSPSPASAATPPSPAARVDLRVLVIDNGTVWVGGFKAALDQEGIPHTDVLLGASARPTINAAFLSAGNEARFQAVFTPDDNVGGL